MKYTKIEVHDFKCRVCGTKWSSYIENNNRCPNVSQEDGRHNFDFGKPIKINPSNKQPGTLEVQEGKITFQ